MKHGHGTTTNHPAERARRRSAQQRANIDAEANRQRAQGGGQPNELGVTQGQNGEQGNTVKPEGAKGRTPVRH